MGNFNVEDAVKNQEKEQNYGSQEAMAKAKENLAEQKLRKETAEIERRLSQSKSSTEDAVKALRMARVREKAQKAYLEALNKADADFCRAFKLFVSENCVTAAAHEHSCAGWNSDCFLSVIDNYFDFIFHFLFRASSFFS